MTEKWIDAGLIPAQEKTTPCANDAQMTRGKTNTGATPVRQPTGTSQMPIFAISTSFLVGCTSKSTSTTSFLGYHTLKLSFLAFNNHSWL